MEYWEPPPDDDALARDVIGAAIEVHRLLGPGFLESVYERALTIELEERGISFARQSTIFLQYKGRAVGEHRLDLLVGERLVVEIKSLQMGRAAQHVVQVFSYLTATDLNLGLLLNFGMPTPREGIKRVLRRPSPLNHRTNGLPY